MTDWIKARSCGDNACVQVRHVPGGVEIRTNPKDAHPATLFATTEEFDAFLAGVKAGDFDRPTMPAEPDPGAYMIGKALCVRWAADDTDGHWAVESASVVGGYFWADWSDAWAAVGGPDVQITPLVPIPAVELPLIEEWYGRDVRVSRTIPSGDFVHVAIDNDFVHLTDHQAEQLAAALIAAARAARDRSGT